MKTPLADLRPPSVVVRGCSPDDIDMTLLTDSIEKNGLLVPLTVCDGKIVDGYRRWLCCKAIGWTEIDVHVVEGEPDALRIIAQSRSTPFDRTDRRILLGDWLQRHRDATAGEVAHAFNWSVQEVESLAGYEYLLDPFKKAYRSGEVSLLEVWHVSRCRDEGQKGLWDEGLGDLLSRSAALHRETRSARRRSMVSRPRGKGYNAILRERAVPTEAGLELIKAKAETPLDGWIACLNWILSTK